MKDITRPLGPAGQGSWCSLYTVYPQLSHLMPQLMFFYPLHNPTPDYPMRNHPASNAGADNSPDNSADNSADSCTDQTHSRTRSYLCL